MSSKVVRDTNGLSYKVTSAKSEPVTPSSLTSTSVTSSGSFLGRLNLNPPSIKVAIPLNLAEPETPKAEGGISFGTPTGTCPDPDFPLTPQAHSPISGTPNVGSIRRQESTGSMMSEATNYSLRGGNVLFDGDNNIKYQEVEDHEKIRALKMMVLDPADVKAFENSVLKKLNPAPKPVMGKTLSEEVPIEDFVFGGIQAPDFEPLVPVGFQDLKKNLEHLRNEKDTLLPDFTSKQHDELDKFISKQYITIDRKCAKRNRKPTNQEITSYCETLSKQFKRKFRTSLPDIVLCRTGNDPLEAIRLRRLAEQPTDILSPVAGALLIPVGIVIYMIGRMFFKKAKPLIPMHESDDATN